MNSVRAALLLRAPRLLALRRALSSVAAPAAVPAPTRKRGPKLAPFHVAIPVHSLSDSRAFYGEVLGCEEGRSSATWIDYNLMGHQIVCHWAGDKYRAVDHFNEVDTDMVPVPHFGVCLTVAAFHRLAKKLRAAKVAFLVEPHLRFPGAPGEQWTMFFKDPSGNSLEFKALTTPANLFARYVV